MKHFIAIALLFATVFGYAQTTYTGKVTNLITENLAGATVQSASNLNNAVVTDLDGNFSITLNDNTTVIVKFLGYNQISQDLTTS